MRILYSLPVSWGNAEKLSLGACSDGRTSRRADLGRLCSLLPFSRSRVYKRKGGGNRGSKRSRTYAESPWRRLFFGTCVGYVQGRGGKRSANSDGAVRKVPHSHSVSASCGRAFIFRFAISLVLTAALLFLCRINASAEYADGVSINEKTRELYGELELDELYELLPEGARELIGDVSKAGSSPFFTPDGIGKWILEVISSALRLGLRGFGRVFALILIASLMKKYCDAIGRAGLSQSGELAFSVAASLVFLNLIRDDLSRLTEFFMWAKAFFTAAVPVMTALYGMGGNVASAAANGAAMTVVLSVSELMSSSLVVPCVKLCFGLSVAGSITGEREFSPVSSFLSGAVSKLCIFFMTLISSGFFFKNILSATADGLAVRSMKFAASAFIPIVGGAVSEATSTVVSAISVLRSSFGAFGAAALAVLFLPLLVRLYMQKLGLYLCSCLCTLLGMKNGAALCTEISGAYSLCISAAVSVSLCLFLFCAIFAKTACVI